jgi:hypothetical protein
MMQLLKAFSIIWLVFSIPAQAQATISFLQVEGMMLGFYPGLGDGVRVESNSGSEIKFAAGERCFKVTRAERAGVAFSGLSFDPEEREDVRNKLTGLMGYPGVSRKELDEEWLKSANGLATAFYRDNLAKKPDSNVIQLIFVPVVLAPKPLQVIKTEWTPEAKQILQAQGWSGLERHCGSHFVEAVGEEDYIIYSIRIEFPGADQRLRIESVRLDRHNQSPGLVLNNLFRMNQRFEFGGPGHNVTIDVLAVGGRPEEIAALKASLAAQEIRTQTETAGTSVINRTQLTCPAGKLEPCQQLAQTFLDYQFGRLSLKGYQPNFAPVRFRIAPIRYLKVMND